MPRPLSRLFLCIQLPLGVQRTLPALSEHARSTSRQVSRESRRHGTTEETTGKTRPPEWNTRKFSAPTCHPSRHCVLSSRYQAATQCWRRTVNKAASNIAKNAAGTGRIVKYLRNSGRVATRTPGLPKSVLGPAVCCRVRDSRVSREILAFRVPGRTVSGNPDPVPRARWRSLFPPWVFQGGRLWVGELFVKKEVVWLKKIAIS